MYQLRITGYIPDQKYHEFIQSLEEIHEQIQNDCEEYIITRDQVEKNLFCLVIQWKNKEPYEAFLQSGDYRILCGSFRVLGNLKKITKREFLDSSFS